MSIGIIGGADGPTAVFVASNSGWILPAVLILIAIIAACTAIALILWEKSRKR